VTRAEAVAQAACDLVGTPFRLQGRDPEHGLDCLGVVITSLARADVALALPPDYRPRRRTFAIPEVLLREAGLIPASNAVHGGDCLLLRTGPAQVHTAVAIDRERIVHAHAGLGRVVLGPLPDSWPVLATWRLAAETVPKGDTSWQR